MTEPTGGPLAGPEASALELPIHTTSLWEDSILTISACGDDVTVGLLDEPIATIPRCDLAAWLAGPGKPLTLPPLGGTPTTWTMQGRLLTMTFGPPDEGIKAVMLPEDVVRLREAV